MANLTPEEELKTYRAIANKFNGDPKLKHKYLELYKEAFTDAAVPEVDVPKQMRSEWEEKLAERDKKIKELEERQFKKEFEDKFNSSRAKLSGPPWYLDDEQIPKVEELIEKRGFPDLESAADYFKATTEPLKPSSLGIAGLTPLKGSRQQRKEFNDRYKGVFRKSKSNFGEIVSDAVDKIKSGEYLKEM